MRVTLLQTSDPARYIHFLKLTGLVNRLYASEQNLEYASYVGIKRGYHPWQATFNRIGLLSEILESGAADWVIYLDADAYVYDLGFDIRAYLHDNQQYSLIAAPGTAKGTWDVNAGVLFLNLKHQAGAKLVRRWSHDFASLVSEEMLRSCQFGWSFRPNDQDLLQSALRDDPELARHLFVERHSFINHPKASFVRQILRAHGAMGTRLRIAKADISATLFNQRPLVAAGLGLHPIARQDTSIEGETMTLTELANKYGSDKGTTAGAPPNRYTSLYDLLFYPFKTNPIRLVEIGLATGGPETGGPVDRTVVSPSIKMWLDYFPKAQIFGFDISDFANLSHPRFTFVRGDAGSELDIQRLVKMVGTAEIIIDDGSHASYHQQIAFKHLFETLVPGGLYIIEGVHWQSPLFEGLLKVPKTAQFFNSYFEDGIYTENSILSQEFMGALDGRVISYSWFPAFDGTASTPKLIIIRKGDPPAL